jgi:hypothetical protein
VDNETLAAPPAGGRGAVLAVERPLERAQLGEADRGGHAGDRPPCAGRVGQQPPGGRQPPQAHEPGGGRSGTGEHRVDLPHRDVMPAGQLGDGEVGVGQIVADVLTKQFDQRGCRQL